MTPEALDRLERLIKSAMTPCPSAINNLGCLCQEQSVERMNSFADAEFLSALLASYRTQESELSRRDRTPIGGNPKDFCACGHHEMNHACYFGMPRACNQTGCECREYVAEARAQEGKPPRLISYIGAATEVDIAYDKHRRRTQEGGRGQFAVRVPRHIGRRGG